MASSTIDSRVFGVLFASKARYHTDSSGCFFGVTVAILTNVMKPSEVLSGYASTTIWLIVCAFMIAKVLANA